MDVLVVIMLAGEGANQLGMQSLDPNMDNHAFAFDRLPRHCTLLSLYWRERRDTRAEGEIVHTSLPSLN